MAGRSGGGRLTEEILDPIDHLAPLQNRIAMEVGETAKLDQLLLGQVARMWHRHLDQDHVVSTAASVESLCGGMVSTAFLSYLMRICQRENAAVQYALLTAAYALPGSIAGSFSGFVTENVGYSTYFALTAAMAIPAFAVLPWAAKRIEAEVVRRPD